MSPNHIWEETFSKEIQSALNARKSGNEGKARVCARRAAGIVVGEYLSRSDKNFVEQGAYDNLKYFLSLPDISPHLKETISYFIVRVNENHELPFEVDLIEEACIIKEYLVHNEKED